MRGGGPGNAPRLAPVPPHPDLVPVRPLVLDLAFEAGVPCPDVGHRAPKGGAAGGVAAAASAATAAASRLFNWGRG